jgi:ferric-dicitrate binding protein FerR (iron transport regulator)
MDRGSAELALTRALESPDVRYLRSSAGQRSTITLLDESTAQLGAMSTLKVPRGFGSAVRGLELDGAARFVVSPDRSPAFQVRARGAAVVATGTEFVARAYEDDTALYVMVREGTVRLHPVAGAASSRSLAAGDAVALDANGTVRELDDAERAQAFSWIDGTLRLEGATVADAVRLMTRWHALTPTLADPSLAARPVTTTLSLESDAAALDSLTRAAGLVSTYDGTTLVLRDAAAVPPKAPPMPPKAAARKR